MEEQSRNSHPVGRQSQREKPEMDSALNIHPLSNLSSQSHTSGQDGGASGVWGPGPASLAGKERATRIRRPNRDSYHYV